MSDIDQDLSVLARTNPDRIKAFVESLIPELEPIEVLQSRTGLVMLPMRDTAEGVAFHLGEVLVSEAHIRSEGFDGYGMRCGHDLEASMAMALIDLALSKGIQSEACHAFCQLEAHRLREVDTETLRNVEATRVDMETF